MTREGRSFDDVLAEAQRLGLAEADPTTDVDGIDSAHKLALLTTLATFVVTVVIGFRFDYDNTHVLQFDTNKAWIDVINTNFRRSFDGFRLMASAS